MSSTQNGGGASETLLDRTLKNLRGTWRGIASQARQRIGGGALRPDLPDEDVPRLTARMEECIAGRGGEVSARARAADLGRAYLNLDATGRRRFLDVMAGNFGVDHAAVAEAARAMLEAADEPARVQAEALLRDALVPARQRLLTQFNALPEGVKFLVDMRADVMAAAASTSKTGPTKVGRTEPGGKAVDAALEALDGEMRRLLAAWFDVGFLDLRRITWASPAQLLEKLIAYEAVHAIRSWDDLKNRLDSDRRCFAFFHPRMPDEPLIFVEVALVRSMADNIQALLDESAARQDPEKADTAIFYSISNAQKGLAGISFGNFLIKRVVDVLAHELPNLKTFATLSPIPGFRAWLDRRLAADEPDLLTLPEEQDVISATRAANARAGLAQLLAEPGWQDRPEYAAVAKGPLMRLCARYLVREQRGGKPLDPVARFHLTNGARVERINWLADTSAKGLRESAGMMVNYLYRLAEIDENHEAFVGEGKIVASGAVTGALKR